MDSSQKLPPQAALVNECSSQGEAAVMTVTVTESPNPVPGSVTVKPNPTHEYMATMASYQMPDSLAKVPNVGGPNPKLNNVVVRPRARNRNVRRSSPETVDRRTIRRLSHFVFVISIFTGIGMYMMATAWFMLFSMSQVIYKVPTNFFTPNAPTTMEVKSPFLFEIKSALEAYCNYICGTLLLILGGCLAFYTLRAPYQYRTFQYIASSLLFMASAVSMASGGISSAMGNNTVEESILLNHDRNYAYQLGVKGSYRFFKHRQCQHIDQSVEGRDEKEAEQMRLFCHLLIRLTLTFCFMIISAIVPMMGGVVCWFQIAFNRSIWTRKANSIKKKKLKLFTVIRCKGASREQSLSPA